MLQGHEVTVLDNFFTGRKKNIQHWEGHPNFHLIVHDVVEPIMLEVDQIYHLACPASPPHYQVSLFFFFRNVLFFSTAVITAIVFKLATASPVHPTVTD